MVGELALQSRLQQPLSSTDGASALVVIRHPPAFAAVHQLADRPVRGRIPRIRVVVLAAIYVKRHVGRRHRSPEPELYRSSHIHIAVATRFTTSPLPAPVAATPCCNAVSLHPGGLFPTGTNGQCSDSGLRLPLLAGAAGGDPAVNPRAMHRGHQPDDEHRGRDDQRQPVVGTTCWYASYVAGWSNANATSRRAGRPTPPGDRQWAAPGSLGGGRRHPGTPPPTERAGVAYAT